jgi:glycogen debranching enzyme
MHLRLRRSVDGAMHDCLTVTSFEDRTIRARFVVQLDTDFSDVFEVEQRTYAPRLGIERLISEDGLRLSYRRADFRRGLAVRLTSRPSVHVGSQLVFDLELAPRAPWACCIEMSPIVQEQVLCFQGDPHGVPDDDEPIGPRIEAAALLADPFRRGVADLAALALTEDGSTPFVAAGAPWFVALFGRDALVTTLMGSLAGLWQGRGILDVLGRTQADRRDDFRDEQPGKLVHELRHGELVHFGVEPQGPYYGAHDAPALYVLALWHTWRWLGDRRLLVAHLDTARRALAWCLGPGDEDGDGFLEYRTRSRVGYRNQGWKDSGDAIRHLDGTLAEPPVATVELQGYLYAARLAMAEMLDSVGDAPSAEVERRAARGLRRRVEERFWMPDAECYALALDGKKRLVESVSSNPGHLLFGGLPGIERARLLARRLLREDMFSGYGLRTLSSENPGWNPLSYQVGSVWPHDTALVAAGLCRYGLRAEAARLLRGLLDAAAVFEHARLPELFCGFAATNGPPVPYERANSPQAWAAAAPVLAAQLFLGLVPDAPQSRCHIDPWLPAWLPSLEIEDVELGDGRLRVGLERSGDRTLVRWAEHPSLEIVKGRPVAPLWGAPVG